MATLNSSDVRSIKIPSPPLYLQEAWANTAMSLRARQEERAASRRNFVRLLSVLLYRALAGELTAKWRETHTKELLAEMEQQARVLSERAEI